MKRLFTLLLALMLLLSLTACGGGDKDPAPSGDEGKAPSSSRQEPTSKPDESTKPDDSGENEEMLLFGKEYTSPCGRVRLAAKEEADKIVFAVASTGLNYEDDSPWIGFCSPGRYADEYEADDADFWYNYIYESPQVIEVYKDSITELPCTLVVTESDHGGEVLLQLDYGAAAGGGNAAEVIDTAKWLDYLTETYDLAFTDSDHQYWANYYPASITENETDEAKSSLFKFEDMPMDMQNVLVGHIFTASAALSGNNNLDPVSGEVIGNATDDLYFYGDSDPSPTKAWNYTYNNAQYNISIALSSSKYVEMTVTAYKGDAAEGGETPVAAGSYDGPFDDYWPDCTWTRLVPRPEFADKNQMDYSVVSLEEYFNSAFSLDVTVEQAQAYAELLKAAGYTINPKDEFADMGSTVLFTYAAEDENGNYASVGYNSLAGTAISVKKIGG